MSDLIDKFFAFIATYKMFILLFTVILIFLKLFSRMLMEEWRQRWHHKWVEKRNKKLELKKQRQEKKQSFKQNKKYRIYKSNNQLFTNIVNENRTIIFAGKPGSGKTSMMQLFTRFLVDRFEYLEKKNKRYYKIMKPKFLEERAFLRQNKLLPVYTNMESVRHPKNNYKPMTNVDEILKLKKKALTPCILQIDEFPNEYGKELRFDVMAEKDPEKLRDYEGIKKAVTKPRHYGFWILGTAQDEDDIVYIFRKVPHLVIKVEKTKFTISQIGKFIQRMLIFLQKFLPGWLVSNPKKMFAETLFTYQKIILFFKLCLPGFFSNEKQFYINRNKIYEKIKESFGYYKTLWNYGGVYYWTYYKTSQSLMYDHLEYASEYESMFDKEGNRKKIGATA